MSSCYLKGLVFSVVCVLHTVCYLSHTQGTLFKDMSDTIRSTFIQWLEVLKCVHALFVLRSKFRLSYYPHCLESFKGLLNEAFGGKMEHSVYGDFKTYVPGQTQAPCYFIHVCKKTA